MVQFNPKTTTKELVKELEASRTKYIYPLSGEFYIAMALPRKEEVSVPKPSGLQVFTGEHRYFG